MDPIQRRDGATFSPSDLLAGVVGNRGENVLADFLVVEFVMTTLQGPKGSNPGVRVDVLDLVIGEGATESTANHRSSGSPELLVETARSLPPCGRVLRRDCDRAGGGDRGHMRLPTVRTPPSRRAPPVTTFPPLVHMDGGLRSNHAERTRVPIKFANSEKGTGHSLGCM